jgi:protein involved in polysaccharide export with SLBB domain
VTIDGEVMFPGTYPIIEGRTKIKEAIEMAGGFTGTASPVNSRIVRDTVTFASNIEYDRLRSFAEGGQDPLETAYIKSRVRQEQGVVEIDFSALDLSDNNVLLRNGDHIIIARNEMTVRVSGAVASPGHVSFEKDAGYQTYVSKAGGFSGNAKKTWIRIRKQGGAVWQSPKSAVDIGPGDEILVGEKPYRESFITLRDVIVMLSSAATVILTIVTIGDQMNK